MVGALPALCDLTFRATLLGKYFYYPQFIDGEVRYKEA